MFQNMHLDFFLIKIKNGTGDIATTFNNNTIQLKKNFHFMNIFNLKSQFYARNTKAGSQLDHIWSNVPNIDTKFGVTEAY